MMLWTQPFDFEWLCIILVMRLRIFNPAYTARPSLEAARANGVPHLLMSKGLRCFLNEAGH